MSRFSDSESASRNSILRVKWIGFSGLGKASLFPACPCQHSVSEQAGKDA